GIRRVRFTTSHPRHFSRDIVDAIDSVETLCPHVHLPVQSGSSRLLSLMLREYTREQYLERIAWIKAGRREISITTDIIVGFPGETNVDFEQTITLLEEVGYDAIFSFKYSPRPNTPSLKYPDSISDDEKASRLAILQERQKQMEVEMKMRGLMMDPVTNMAIVVLKESGSETVLPIWVGIYEANAIALEIEKVSTPRPMTHDLIKNLLIGLDTQVHKIVVSEL